MKRTASGWTVFCLVIGFALLSRAAAETRSIRLEDVKSKETFGPFVLDRKAPVVIDGRVYEIVPYPNGKIAFRAREGQAMQGPYDVTLGRMVSIGPRLYTIIDISRHAASSRPDTRPAAEAPVQTPRRAPTPLPGRPPPSGSWRSARDQMRYQYATEAPRAGGLGAGVGIALDLSVFERTDYDREIGGVRVDEATMERRSLGLMFHTGRLILRGGTVYDAEWDTPVAGTGRLFSDADLSNGDGWWVAVDLRNTVWGRDAWALQFSARGSYRREEYDLRYDVQQASGTVVIDATNGTPGTAVQLYEAVAVADQTELSETRLDLGLSLSRVDSAWSCYLGFDVIVWEDAELDTPITTEFRSYKVELQHADPIAVTAGASRKHWGVHWFADLKLISEDALRVGAAFVF